MAEDKEITLKEKDILEQIAESTKTIELLAKQMYAEMGKAQYLQSLLEDK